MRWTNLTTDADSDQQPVLPGAVVRTFDTPGFGGKTFYEVRAKSIINKLKNSRMGFEYTINPYRGCTHACTYCLLGDTPILMADRSTKPIASLEIGDEIIGTVGTMSSFPLADPRHGRSAGDARFRNGQTRREAVTTVLAKWPTIKQGYRLVLKDGRRLVASGDHRFLTSRGWRHVTNVLTGTHNRPYLTVGNLLVGLGSDKGGHEVTEVVSIEPLGRPLPMWDITTGTGDFIANGVISHNCFARNSHTYLDLDYGHDFDSRIVVKVNAVELLRRELASSGWGGASIAMGTNVDVYQRAEGRYELMPGIISALSQWRNPFSILTKGTLILRDLPLLVEASERAKVSIAFSIGLVNESLWRAVEPGTPSPLRRIDAVRQFTDAGMPVGVLMAPILPGLSDDEASIDATVAALASSGADRITPLVLHLRPGAREWYMGWLEHEHPSLLPLYQRLYRGGSYASQDYQRLITARVRRACRRHGIAPRDDSPRDLASAEPPPEPPEPTSYQPTLL